MASMVNVSVTMLACDTVDGTAGLACAARTEEAGTPITTVRATRGGVRKLLDMPRMMARDAATPSARAAYDACTWNTCDCQGRRSTYRPASHMSLPLRP